MQRTERQHTCRHGTFKYGPCADCSQEVLDRYEIHQLSHPSQNPDQSALFQAHFAGGDFSAEQLEHAWFHSQVEPVVTGKPLWFFTNYQAENDPGIIIGGYICARNAIEANQAAELRGLGELVAASAGTRAPYKTVSQLMRQRNRNDVEILHGCMYLGWLAEKAKVTTLSKLMTDDGLLHEVSHAISFQHDEDYLPDHSWKELTMKVEELEQKIPGYCPKFEAQP
jgi:hypothetical protein